MRKILISPLGSGPLQGDKAQRVYRTATYHIEDQPYDSSFVASVLYEHIGLDDIIFIGTVKSMWEEVYRFFCEKRGVALDESLWLDLAQQIDDLNHTSDPTSLDLRPVEALIGDRSRCLLIHYGLTEDELWSNFDTVIQLISTLDNGDEVHIDITHSFRSLSLFLFLVMTFISDLSDKQIQIGGIYYGMLDVSRELGYAPIVNLKSFFDLTQWTKGAHSLKNFGNGYLIADLLHQMGKPRLAAQLKKFSDVVNLNYLDAIKIETQRLKTALKQSPAVGPFKYLQPVLDDFIHRFDPHGSAAQFQLELAGWYFENRRYATGYIVLQESILTYLCESKQLDPIKKENRDLMKDVLWKQRNTELGQIYAKITPIRNDVAHPNRGRSKSQTRYVAENVEQAYQRFETVKRLISSHS